MMQHTNMLRSLCVGLDVVGKGKCGKTYEFFKERQQQELYHCENSFFFLFSTSNLLQKRGTEIFLFFLIMCIASVPNFCKSFAFGTVLHKNVIALADLFPISCQWKDISVKFPYLQYNLICGTQKMPCSSSLPNHQHLQSDALNSDGSFVCKYCSNCV